MGMKRVLLAVSVAVLLATPLLAHLCNDVFVQAKDNLAVKVDIRDDQLRISKSGAFRVYLLNTMDRVIDNIELEVRSKEFDAKVKPSPEWRGFPRLETVLKGGKKEYFEVELTRKPGTAQGKYKIELHLFNGRDSDMVFKTVDMDEAISLQKVPKASPAPKLDGGIDSAEWGKALACDSLYEYKRRKQYMENCETDVQTRFRFQHDAANLYCAIDFQKLGKSDTARIYVAKDYDSAPAVIEISPQSNTATLDGSPCPEMKVVVKDTKVELSAPLSKLGVSGGKSFYVNMTRSRDKIETYWKGNKSSVSNPLVFAKFVMD